MATKKYESMRIMSLEGSVLYKNEGFTATKDGKPDPQAFRGILDESLDTLKLAEVYDRHEDEIGYPYLDGKKRFCRAVVNHFGTGASRPCQVPSGYGAGYDLPHAAVRADRVLQILPKRYHEVLQEKAEEKEHMERFLLPSLESVMDAKIKDSEGRIRNVEFKMGVQIAMLTELLAEYLNYSEEDLDRLRADAIRHLKETNGSFRF